jgi:hypothetical protein
MKTGHILKQEWKEKILKELKGKKNLDDLVFTIQKGLVTDALLLEEDRIYNDDLFSFPDQPSFGLSIKEQGTNKDIIESLKCGASSVCVMGKAEWNWKALLKDIHLDYIHLYVVADNNFNMNWNGIVPDNINQSQHITYISDNSIIHMVDSYSDGTLINDLKSVLKDSDGGIILNISDHFILNISLLRAIRSIVQKTRPEVKILVQLSPNGKSEEYDLIQFSTQAMSAISGGADCILYPFNTSMKPQQVARMMHIQNIIAMESQATSVKDPWKGAYLIEHVTQVLINELDQ